MIEKISKSQGNVLGYRATGKLTNTDYKEILIPGIEAVVKEYGKVNFLFYLDEEFKGWEPIAMWDDFKLGLGKIKSDIAKFALVGGPLWVQWAMKLDNHIMRGEVKIFSIDQQKEAWDWLTEK